MSVFGSVRAWLSIGLALCLFVTVMLEKRGWWQPAPELPIHLLQTVLAAVQLLLMVSAGFPLHQPASGESEDRLPALRFAEICAVSFSLVAVVLVNEQIASALGFFWQVVLTVVFALYPIASSRRERPLRARGPSK